MKKYDAYMPSGIDWIGEIPEEWELKRGRYIVKLLSGFPADSNLFTDDDSFMPLIRIRDIDNTTTEVFYKGDYPKEYLIQYNDVLVGMDGDFNIAKWKGSNAILNQRVCKIIETDEMLANYAYYLLQTPLTLINDVTYSTTVKHLSTNDIKDFRFPVPPRAEQIAITNYLDAKCAKIDNVVAVQQKRIELLKELKQSIITKTVTKGLDKNAKMKDSGIEWIGEIPEEWKVMRIKYVAKQNESSIKIGPFGSALTGKIIEDGECKVYGQWNIIDKDFSVGNNSISRETFNELISYKVFPKDILISMMGTVGKCAIIPNEIQDGVMDSHVVKIRLEPKLIDSNYFEYVYDKDNSQIVYEQIQKSKKGSIMDGLNSSLIKDFIIPVPPLEEQTAIAAYLDLKCATIDKQIQKVEKQIDLLNEYKQSVITECVTGKRKVC